MSTSNPYSIRYASPVLESGLIPQVCDWFVDRLIGGVWVRVWARIAPPDPDVGRFRPEFLQIRAIDDDGVLVELTSHELAQIERRFEESYYQKEQQNARQRY